MEGISGIAVILNLEVRAQEGTGSARPYWHTIWAALHEVGWNEANAMPLPGRGRHERLSRSWSIRSTGYWLTAAPTTSDWGRTCRWARPAPWN